MLTFFVVTVCCSNCHSLKFVSQWWQRVSAAATCSAAVTCFGGGNVFWRRRIVSVFFYYEVFIYASRNYHFLLVADFGLKFLFTVILVSLKISLLLVAEFDLSFVSFKLVQGASSKDFCCPPVWEKRCFQNKSKFITEQYFSKHINIKTKLKH